MQPKKHLENDQTILDYKHPSKTEKKNYYMLNMKILSQPPSQYHAYKENKRGIPTKNFVQNNYDQYHYYHMILCSRKKPVQLTKRKKLEISEWEVKS